MNYKKHNLKLGLCCLFHKENIKFKTYTKTALLKLEADQVQKWIKIVKEIDSIERKKPEIGDFNKALRLTNK